MNDFLKRIKMADFSLLLLFITVFPLIILLFLIRNYFPPSSLITEQVEATLLIFTGLTGILVYILSREIGYSHKSLYQFFYKNKNHVYRDLKKRFLSANKPELECLFKKDKSFWEFPLGETSVYRATAVIENDHFLLRLSITKFLSFKRITGVEVKTNPNNAPDEQGSTGEHLYRKKLKDVLEAIAKINK